MKVNGETHAAQLGWTTLFSGHSTNYGTGSRVGHKVLLISHSGDDRTYSYRTMPFRTAFVPYRRGVGSIVKSSIQSMKILSDLTEY